MTKAPDYFRSTAITAASRVLKDERSEFARAQRAIKSNTGDVFSLADEVLQKSDKRASLAKSKVLVTTRRTAKTWRLVSLAVQLELTASKSRLITVSAASQGFVRNSLQSIFGCAAIDLVARHSSWQDGLFGVMPITGDPSVDNASIEVVALLEGLGFITNGYSPASKEEIEYLHRQEIGSSFTHAPAEFIMYAPPELVEFLSSEELAIRDWFQSQVLRGSWDEASFEKWATARVSEISSSAIVRSAFSTFYSTVLKTLLERWLDGDH